jgi:hypothetical protein
MGSIDDIKKKLNIDEMDKDSRKGMFEKFVEKGGKVIQEKKPNYVKINKDRQGLIKQKLDRAKQKKDLSADSEKEPKQYYGQDQLQPGKMIKRYFSVFMTGYFQGIFSFGGNFKNKFSQEMQDDFVTIIKDLKQDLGKMINLYPEKKWQLTDMLNTENGYGFEILVRFYDLLGTESLTKTANFFKIHNSMLCPLIINEIKSVFKRLLILYPYWETSKDILWEAQQIYKAITTLDPPLQKPRINRCLDRLFAYYFPRLLTILNYNIGKKTPFDLNKMHEYAKISVENDIGSITKELVEQKKEYLIKLEKEKEERLKKLQEEVDQKEMDKIPKYVHKGLAMIDAIIETIPKKVQDDDNARLFESGEKLLEYYFLFKDFDVEYSFIMTTSQLRINTTLEGGTRIDVKSDFDNLYIRFSEINSYLKEYLKLLQQFYKIKEDLRDSHMLLDQKLSNLKLKRIQTLNEIRSRSAVFFKKLAVILQTLIEDYNTDKKFLQNGDDILHFQLELGDKRKFENTKIISFILITFSFVSALHYYLTSGKLSGKGLFLHNDEKEKDPGDTNNTTPDENPKNGPVSNDENIKE